MIGRHCPWYVQVACLAYLLCVALPAVLLWVAYDSLIARRVSSTHT